MTVSGLIPRDGSRVPLLDPTFGVVAKATPSAFTGGSANTRGNDGGTLDPLTLFTVTGDVLARVYGVCTVDLTGANATVEVGIAGNTACFIAQTTGTTIDAGEHWFDGTPVASLPFASVPQRTLSNGQNIIETVGTANVTAGQIYYICIYYPLTPGSDVVAA